MTQLRALATARDGDRGSAAWTVAVLIALAAPALRMAGWVRAGTPVQFADYWLIIDVSTKRSGWPSARGLLSLHNEHLLVAPKVLYWLNGRLLTGSNITLGYVVIVIGSVPLLVGVLHLARRRDLRPPVLVACALAASATVFVPQAAWSYLRAMSGAAWLTADAFAVGAVVLACRRRPGWAAAAATLAAASYGTGLAVFPAILLVGLLLDRDVRRQWPVVVAGAACAGVYRALQVHDGREARPAGSNLLDVPGNMATMVGSVLTTDATRARAIGALLLVGGIVLAAVAARGGVGRSAFWVGTMAYGTVAVAVVAVGRDNGVTDFVSSRYSSLSTIVWLAALGLLALVGGRHLVTTVPLGAVAVAALSGSTGAVDAAFQARLQQEEMANALALGVAGGSTRFIGFGIEVPPVRDKLVALGHHPFAGRWDADCGLLDERLPAERVRPAGSHGVRSVVRAPQRPVDVPRAVQVTGWVEDADDVRCVLLVDPDDTVVGLGVSGLDLIRTRAIEDVEDVGGIRALAPAGTGPLRAFVVFDGSDEIIQLGR